MCDCHANLAPKNVVINSSYQDGFLFNNEFHGQTFGANPLRVGASPMTTVTNMIFSPMASGLVCIGSINGQPVFGPAAWSVVPGPWSGWPPPVEMLNPIASGALSPAAAGSIMVNPFASGPPSPAATGSICMLGADGKLVPLVPSGLTPMSSSVASGGVYLRTESGQLIPLCA